MGKNIKIKLDKVIVILGPTSSGKSEAAIKLAKKFGGEIISADSRQIYSGMDIGTGKIEPDRPGEIPREFAAKDKFSSGFRPFISNGVAHYMIDIVSPKADYNVSDFKKDAKKIIADILSRGKLPIICGGTGFWIKAVVDNVIFPEVKPDWKLRKKLDKKSITELIQELKKLDPQRAQTIDVKNKVRLIRAIEICKSIGMVPPLSCHCERSEAISQQTDKRLPRSLCSLAMTESYKFLQIGLDILKEKLHQNIKKRLAKRWRAGMVKEVEKLKKSGLSWKKIQSFGLGYFWIPLYLQGKLSKAELFEKVYLAEKDYAKRQMTWFQKDKRIKWIKNYKDMEKELIIFLKKSGHQ